MLPGPVGDDFTAYMAHAKSAGWELGPGQIGIAAIMAFWSLPPELQVRLLAKGDPKTYKFARGQHERFWTVTPFDGDFDFESERDEIARVLAAIEFRKPSDSAHDQTERPANG